MKKPKMKWLLLLAAMAVVIGGCSTGNTGGSADPGNNEGGVEQPAPETPAEGQEPAEEAPGAEQPAEEQPVELKVTTGGTIEVETMIEGMKETVEVTEYTLEPYGISYQLRTLMGEPAVEDGAVVYKTQMGDDVANLELKVLENATLDEAAAALQAEFEAEGGTAAGAVEDTSSAATTLQGKRQSFEVDNGYFAGYSVYALGDHAFAIKYHYPAEAGDGMAAVQTELVKSLKE